MNIRSQFNLLVTDLVEGGILVYTGWNSINLKRQRVLLKLAGKVSLQARKEALWHQLKSLITWFFFPKKTV